MSDEDERYKRLETKLDEGLKGLEGAIKEQTATMHDIGVMLGRLDERMSAEREANGRLRDEVQKVASDLWAKVNGNHEQIGKLKIDLAHTRGRDRVLGGAIVLVLSGLVSLVVSFFRGG